MGEDAQSNLANAMDLGDDRCAEFEHGHDTNVRYPGGPKNPLQTSDVPSVVEHGWSLGRLVRRANTGSKLPCSAQAAREPRRRSGLGLSLDGSWPDFGELDMLNHSSHRLLGNHP
jgi:hypothetical protein